MGMSLVLSTLPAGMTMRSVSIMLSVLWSGSADEREIHAAVEGNGGVGRVDACCGSELTCFLFVTCVWCFSSGVKSDR